MLVIFVNDCMDLYMCFFFSSLFGSESRVGNSAYVIICVILILMYVAGPKPGKGRRVLYIKVSPVAARLCALLRNYTKFRYRDSTHPYLFKE